MRQTAPEGRGPPSYFSRNTLAHASYTQLFLAHMQITNLTSIFVILLYGYYNFASENLMLFPLIGNDIPHTSKNASACGVTHIGPEGNYI